MKMWRVLAWAVVLVAMAGTAFAETQFSASYNNVTYTGVSGSAVCAQVDQALRANCASCKSGSSYAFASLVYYPGDSQTGFNVSATSSEIGGAYNDTNAKAGVCFANDTVGWGSYVKLPVRESAVTGPTCQGLSGDTVYSFATQMAIPPTACLSNCLANKVTETNVPEMTGDKWFATYRMAQPAQTCTEPPPQNQYYCNNAQTYIPVLCGEDNIPPDYCVYHPNDVLRCGSDNPACTSGTSARYNLTGSVQVGDYVCVGASGSTKGCFYTATVVHPMTSNYQVPTEMIGNGMVCESPRTTYDYALENSGGSGGNGGLTPTQELILNNIALRVANIETSSSVAVDKLGQVRDNVFIGNQKLTEIASSLSGDTSDVSKPSTVTKEQLYTAKQTEGLAGLWERRSSELRQTRLASFVSGFVAASTVEFRPRWDFDLGVYGKHTLEISDSIVLVLRGLVWLSALIAVRRNVMGG